MTRAIVLREIGGPEKLQCESVCVGPPGPDDLRVRHTAIGVNFHDTYVRSGLYQTLTLPGIPGLEAAAVVQEVGSKVTGFAPGDRISYVDPSYGAYAQERILPARLALRLPEGITDEVGACLTIKALTAHMLLRQVRAVRTGDALLIHAAAGGVGQHLVRWGKHLGAQVIATVGSREKEEIVRACGADHVILYRQQNFVERVAQLTAGVGVDVVYDSVGADTFFGSLDCLGYRGTLVNFGQSSGPVPPFAVSLLSVRSNAVVRPMLFHYIRERHAFESMAHEAFTALEDGIIQARIDMRVPLSRAADAHIALESRSTSGAIILLPDA